MGFIILLILTTLSIAGSAAFFSIYGLAQIFAGSFWPVVVMASSLEAGKLVAASYVYRFWDRIGFLMKTYLITAILTLMLITSAGIFGFLSAAYQQDILPLEEMESRITLIDERKVEIEKLKQDEIVRRNQLNKQVDDLPHNFATKRAEVRAQIKPELDQIIINMQRLTDESQRLTQEQHELKGKVIHQKVHTGPIVFIAEAFDHQVDDATKWMILLIIFAFDPLAVILTIGVNIAIFERKSEKSIDDEEVFDEPEPSITDIDSLLASENAEGAMKALTSEDLKAALQEMSNRELTPAELAQRDVLEEFLRKKEITEKVRNHAPLTES